MDPLRQQRGNQHEHPASHDRVDEIPAQEMLYEWSKRERRDDFWQHDEEVEDTHVYTHPLWWQSARKNGIRHRENACPRHAAQREQQPILLLFAVDEADGEQAQSARRQTQAMYVTTVKFSRRRCERPGRPTAVARARCA